MTSCVLCLEIWSNDSSRARIYSTFSTVPSMIHTTTKKTAGWCREQALSLLSHPHIDHAVIRLVSPSLTQNLTAMMEVQEQYEEQEQQLAEEGAESDMVSAVP